MRAPRVDSQEYDRLLERLDLFSDASLPDLLKAVHAKLDELAGELRDQILYSEKLEGQIAELENAGPDEGVARLIHENHGGWPLADLSLCPHPDCYRLHHG